MINHVAKYMCSETKTDDIKNKCERVLAMLEMSLSRKRSVKKDKKYTLKKIKINK